MLQPHTNQKVKTEKPLNSTKRSRKRMEVIYKDISHNALKKEERVRKNAENALNSLKR